VLLPIASPRWAIDSPSPAKASVVLSHEPTANLLVSNQRLFAPSTTASLASIILDLVVKTALFKVSLVAT